MKTRTAARSRTYLLFFGRLSDRPIGFLSRAGLGLGGMALAMPGNDIIGMTNSELAVYAAVLIGAGLVIASFDRRQQLVEDVAGST